jgi:hypothetical protein
LLDQVVRRISDPRINRGDVQVAIVESFILRGAGIAVYGHDHHLACGSAIVGGNRNACRRHLGSADSHEARADELAEVAEAIKAGGRGAGTGAKALVVGVDVDQPPVAEGVEVVVHDGTMKQVGIVDAAVDVVVSGFFGNFGLPALHRMSGGGGVAGGHRVRPATVKVHADETHKRSGSRVPHGGGGESQVVRE